jgi:hypothetical protein
MKTFGTIDELIEFVSNQENIETLRNGEITLKDWSEDFKALRKYCKEYGQETNAKKAWMSQKEEWTKKIAELTEQLSSANDELMGLREIHLGDDKENLQRLNAENIAAKLKIKHLEKQVAMIPDLQRKIDTWNSSRIVEAAKKAAAHYNVPQNIIDDPDFEWIVTNDLAIDDMGNVYVKGAYLQNEYEYIVAKQKDRTHWKPLPKRESKEGGVFPDEEAAIASLFSESGSGKKMHQTSRDYLMSDEEAAIAALFG